MKITDHQPFLKVKTFLFLLFIFAITVFGKEDDIEKQKKELSEIRQKIKATEERIKILSSQEIGLLKRIEAIEEKTNLTRQLIKKLERTVAHCEQEIKDLTRNIKTVEERIKAKEADVDLMVITLYKIKTKLPLELLLSGKPMPQVYSKIINLNYIGEETRFQIEELSGLRKELERDKKRLLLSYEDLQKLKLEKEQEEKRLKENQARERQALAKIRQEKSAQKKIEEELKEAEKKLRDLIAEFERRREERKLKPGTHYLEVQKNALPWPIRGRVVSTFGSQFHPKYKTRTKNNGIDIETEFGSPVIAIGPGRVVYADRFWGYGNMVIVDHNEGYYSIYADLAELSVYVGQEVKAQTVLGKSSDNLHFEIRKEGQPVNPLEWLKP